MELEGHFLGGLGGLGGGRSGVGDEDLGGGKGNDVKEIYWGFWRERG